MKILHVINSLAPGGAEKLVADLTPACTAMGAIVYVLALDSRGDIFSERMRDAGVKVDFLRTSISPYALSNIFGIAGCIKKIKPDIVHAHLAPTMHWCAAAAILVSKKNRGTQQAPTFVVTEHAIHNRRMNIAPLRPIERMVYGTYDHIVSVAQEGVESLQRWLHLKIPACTVIPNGIALQGFSQLPPPDAAIVNFAAGRKIIIMTARFVPAKDHLTLLHALDVLPPAFALVFVGDGPTRAAVEAAAVEKNLGGRVLFAGTKNDVRPALAAADIYVQSSFSEGFGIAALEAMAAGVPVVASAVGGLTDLVRDAGLLFPAQDARACADAIMRIYNDENSARDLVQAGKTRAAQYAIDKHAAAYMDLYAVLRSPRSR